MKPLKNFVKTLLRVDARTGVTPLNNMTFVGSKPHGYWIPANFLDQNSICYCVGAGDDISFDTELKVLYDSKIFIFDPTPASKLHFNTIKEISRQNQMMPSVSQDDTFTYRISFKQMEDLHFISVGVWSEKTVLKFFDPGIENYVSHSAYLFKDSKNTAEFPVDTLKNFMSTFHHSTIDILKLEIEGAEYEVLDNLIRDRLDIKVILVEFDEIFHKKGISHFFRIKKYYKRLKKAGYVLVHSTEMFKRTFIRKDVYGALKAKDN